MKPIPVQPALRRFTLALAACALAAGPGAAQTAHPPPAEGKAEEVLYLSPYSVSAQGDSGYFAKNTLAGTRSNERLVNIPQNIQIVTQELLQDIALDNPVDAMTYGSSGINKRASLAPDMYIRGFRNLSFLKDNIPTGGGQYTNAALYDLDRIEVVKGPAALLYGQAAAIGGLVNYLTKRPTDRPAASLKATAGSFDLYRFEANASGPIGDTGLKHRTTVAYSDQGGPRRFEYREDKYFSTALDYRLTPKSLLSLDYSFYFRDENTAVIPVDTNSRIIAVPDDFTPFEAWVKYPNYNQSATVTLKQSISPTLESQVVLNFLQHDNDWDEVLPSAVNATTGLMDRLYLNERYSTRSMNLLVDFVKSFQTGSVAHKVSFGGIGFGRKMKQYVDFALLPALNINQPVYNTPFPAYIRSVPSPGAPGPDAEMSRTRQESAYLQEQATFLDGKAIVVAGVRFNQFDTNIQNLLSNTWTNRHDHAVVKRYGAVYKPVSSTSLYYNYSEAFVFNSGRFVGGPRNGEPLDPSVAENHEFGVKVESSNGRIFGSAAVFDLTLTNVRVLYPLGNGQNGVGQFGSQNNRGYELDLGLSFTTPAGPLQAILTYYEGDLKNENDQLPDGVVNETWSVYVSQAFTTGRLQGLKAGFGAYHKGDVGFGTPGGQPKFIFPAYTTTNAVLSYGWDQYRVALNVDNVFDKFYVQGGQGAESLDLNVGRTLKFSVEYRF
ncbi:MAG: TonB-dependent siderophore receptor [Opitutaceae bacterium]|nr:TonB-dependent siderophore receptor [Opitutaceae bacterium]